MTAHTVWKRLRRAIYLGLGKLYPLPGDAPLGPALLGLGLIVLLVQTATTAFDAVTDLVQKGAGLIGLPWHLAGLAFPILLLALWLLARRGAAELVPRVEAEQSPRPARCLVLLLTAIRPEQRAALADCRGAIADAAERAPLAGPPAVSWGKDIAATAHHLGDGARAGRLERVVAIGTAGPNGSEAQVAAFRALVLGLEDRAGWRLGDPARPGGALRVESLAEALGTAAPTRGHDLDGRAIAFDAKAGLEMENLQQFAAVLDLLLRRLAHEHGGEAEVMVDITGQGKTSTAAAVALAVLVPRRRFQYVTQDRRVIAYDVTVDLPETQAR